MDRYSLFERYGVELEYMIVGGAELRVQPISDEILAAFAGEISDEYINGPVTWSNELVMHVIELKSSEPAKALWPLVSAFQRDIQTINAHLKSQGRQLLPTGMHPLMEPNTETKLWPHGCREIYRAFNSIFNCRGHGWANLQSVHLNLPFANDDEFFRLHTAIRLLLPLIPALSASSPIVEGRLSDTLDTRLDFYRTNCRRVPSVTGSVIPEPIRTPAEYEEKILQRIYKELPPTQPENILKREWVNARGAIARFDRNTIEIRVIDTQECPQMDIALLCFFTALLQAQVRERWVTVEQQFQVPTESLSALFVDALRVGGEAKVDTALAAAWGASAPCSIKELLGRLLQEVAPASAPWVSSVQHILRYGSLSQRIRRHISKESSRDAVLAVYHTLAGCLEDGRPFV